MDVARTEAREYLQRPLDALGEAIVEEANQQIEEQAETHAVAETVRGME